MKKFIYFLITVILLSGCEEFLTETPENNLTLDNAVKDYSSACNVLNGIYSKIQEGSNLGGDIASVYSKMTGFYGNNSNDYYKMTYKQGVYDNSRTWQQYYSVINAANAAIYCLEKLPDEKYPSPNKKKEMIAEAKGLRAWINANLFWAWGHWWADDEDKYGLLFREDVSNITNIQIARLTVGDSYKKIFEDIDAALTHIPRFSSSRYMSKEMVMVLKAKLLLNRGQEDDYINALKIVQDLKNNKPASIDIESDITEMYDQGWDSKETLWARYIDEGAGYSARYSKEFFYSYSLVYNSNICEQPTIWVENDPRYEYIWGEAEAPETWDTSIKECFVKLAQGGKDGNPNDNFTCFYFRWAELYYMESELLLRINPGNFQAALEPVNLLRGMRTVPKLEPLLANSFEEAEDKLFKDYCMEFFLENNSEYFASLRFKHNGKPWIYTLKPDVDITTNKFCLPIPDYEMTNNKLMIQNPDLK